MKYIAVFCSANELEEKFTKPAEEFAKLMVQHGYDLVYGGSDRGLMKQLASAAHFSSINKSSLHFLTNSLK